MVGFLCDKNISPRQSRHLYLCLNWLVSGRFFTDRKFCFSIDTCIFSVCIADLGVQYLMRSELNLCYMKGAKPLLHILIHLTSLLSNKHLPLYLMKCQSCKVKGYKYGQNSSSLEVLQAGLTLVGGCKCCCYWKLHVNNDVQWVVQEMI